MTQEALDRLIALLDLERIEVDIFRGSQPEESLLRVFGGQVAGQALVAAGRTAPEDRPVHSLHAYFLRPGDPSVPIVYEVDRIRDGRSFSTRRVVAIQHGKAIFTMSASFQVLEEGYTHSDPMPEVAPPDELPTLAQVLEPYLDDPLMAWVARPRPIEIRHAGTHPRVAKEKGLRIAEQKVWMRANGTLPDDPLLHVCAVAFASDMTLLDSTLSAHGRSWGPDDVVGASLDHAMWFHRPFRADEWFLYSQRSPRTGAGRGLATGQIFTQDGDLAVSVVQEGLIRMPRQP
ncbi:MAG: acyl-CoA thioesterase II [Mycobacteriales bacterium]|nr:acyl-CoA thioesterase II [Mycobacteriales bacterium]